MPERNKTYVILLRSENSLLKSSSPNFPNRFTRNKIMVLLTVRARKVRLRRSADMLQQSFHHTPSYPFSGLSMPETNIAHSTKFVNCELTGTHAFFRGFACFMVSSVSAMA